MTALWRTIFTVVCLSAAASPPWTVAAGPAEGAWQGRISSSPDSSAQGYAVSHREICGFDSIDFSAALGSGRLTAAVDNARTGGKPVTGTVAANGNVELWMTWRNANKSFDMKLSGRFSDAAFIGNAFGSFQATEGRNPVSWTCRADVFMARAPLTVDDVIAIRQGLGGGAKRDAVLAALDEKAAASPPAAVAPSPAAAPAAAPAASPPADDVARQLALMKQLLDGKLIDQAEFERRRGALLDKAFGGAPAERSSAPPPLPGMPQASASARLASASPASPAAPPVVPVIDWGRYHALVIGINDYRELPKLHTAINDALRVADLLERQYGFKIHKLINPTHQELVDALDVMRETLTGNDNLLIYYAGHGYLDEGAERGYWLPVDAQPNRRSKWVSNTTITDTLRSLLAKHVMIVADSCFSGTLSRDANIRQTSGDYWKRISSKAARVTLTSGGLEPVADNNGRGHSPFAAAFIEVLQENTGVMDGTSLFTAMRRPVMLNANQTPEYSDVRGAGHDGGDFVFVRKP